MARNQKRGVEDAGNSETAVVERVVAKAAPYPETGAKSAPEPQAVAGGKGEGVLRSLVFGGSRTSRAPWNDPARRAAQAIQDQIKEWSKQYPNVVCYCFDGYSTLVYVL